MLYTTGEVAKLCGVSVRTVQYYDTRGILVPHELSEGGRRLYSQEDLDKMRIICFLRDMGFSIDNIGILFSDKSSEQTISMLIEQQDKLLNEELCKIEEKVERLGEMKRALKNFEGFSVQSIGDVAYVMKNQKKRRKVLGVMFAVGIVMDIIQVIAVAYAVQTGNWLPFFVGMPLTIAMGVAVSVYYFRHSAYICPNCHERFKPKAWESLWAAHTPNTRRLCCPKCGKKSFCVEIYNDIKSNKKN